MEIPVRAIVLIQAKGGHRDEIYSALMEMTENGVIKAIRTQGTYDLHVEVESKTELEYVELLDAIRGINNVDHVTDDRIIYKS